MYHLLSHMDAFLKQKLFHWSRNVIGCMPVLSPDQQCTETSEGYSGTKKFQHLIPVICSAIMMPSNCHLIQPTVELTDVAIRWCLRKYFAAQRLFAVYFANYRSIYLQQETSVNFFEMQQRTVSCRQNCFVFYISYCCV